MPMQINRVTLSFSGKDRHLEKAFLKNYLDKSLRFFRITLLFGLFLIAAFGLLDAVLFPEIKSKLWFIRYGLVCPFGLLVLAFTYTSLFRKYWQATIAVMVIFAGLGIIAMMAMAQHTIDVSNFACLVLVLVFSYTVPRAPFVWSSSAGWILVLCYEIAAMYIINTPREIFINNNYYFVSANLIGMITCYFLEFSNRENYWLMQRVEEETCKVNRINSQLQEKNRELEAAMENVKILSGFIPICVHCKKIRDDEGYWNQLEYYLSTHSEIQFSHSLCPECMKKLYPEVS